MGGVTKESSDENLMKTICQKYSNLVTSFYNATYNISKGAQLVNNIFESSYALCLNRTSDWRNLLKDVDRRLLKIETIQKSLCEVSHIYNTCISDNVFDEIPLPESLQFLLSKNP